MAIHLNRLYTKVGDKGQTHLAAGVKVSKASIHVESYGDSDEVNSQLGVIRSWAMFQHRHAHPEVALETEQTFERIQNVMFDIGAALASPLDDSQSGVTQDVSQDVSQDERVLFLENRIDAYRDEFDAVDSFTIPGGCMLNAYAHVARTVCRRWERTLVRRQEEIGLPRGVLIYANRLSDYLYAYSRWVSRRLADEELLWAPGAAAPSSNTSS